MGQSRRPFALPAADDAIVSTYQWIVHPVSLRRHDRTDGWFERYCGDLIDPAKGQRYLRAVRHSLCLPSHPVQGLRVLELGCGFGLTCTTLAMLGAAHVSAIDTNPQMIATFNSYLGEMGLNLPINAQVAPAHDLPFEDDSFDLVITVEALSHFLQPRQALVEAHRVLKPGGRLVIADDNNALNPAAVRQTQEIWERFENGPPTPDLHGHRILEPYVQRRARLIAEMAPTWPDERVQQLAKRTAYMVRAQIQQAIHDHERDGTLPDSVFQPDRCPVEPESGQFIENLIDPLALTQELHQLGFDAKPQAYFGGESRGGLVLAANDWLNEWLPNETLFSRSEGFRIHALKRL
jgi:ubiquinone/menaquinone biosynthesis C-methylase UbiE